MKRYGLMAAALVMAACGSSNTSPTPALPTTYTFTAQMVAANEVPPISNAEAGARGVANITFNVTRDAAGAITGGTVSFVYNLSNFPPGSATTASHIHNAAAGLTGGVYIGTGQTAANNIVVGADGTVSNVSFPNVTGGVDAVKLQAIIDNPAGHYFNVHTVLNPSGVVRGQLVKQ